MSDNSELESILYGTTKTTMPDSQGVIRTVFITAHLEEAYKKVQADCNDYNSHNPKCPICHNKIVMSVRPRIQRNAQKNISERVYDRVIKCTDCTKKFFKESRIYFDVQYSKQEVAKAKQLGMKYDGYLKCWYMYKNQPENLLKLATVRFNEVDYDSLAGIEGFV